jgi:hypothetical protein
MSWKIKTFVLLLSLLQSCGSVNTKPRPELVLSEPRTDLKIIVVRKDFPLLKILLPGQPASERGIEVEFPEHVTGLNENTKRVEHLYLVTRGNQNKRSLPVWKVEKNVITYETELNDMVKMIAKAQLEPDGVRYTYEFNNHSNVSYQNFQAVTCVKLYSNFSDTFLERTYVHHRDGFDLMASETPQRLTMPLEKWLPCRYLVSYSWPVSPSRIEKDENSVTRYNKSRKADKPFIATLSHDKKWIAATYTSETGNLWTNPERTCQHADPAILLNAGETKNIQLKTFIFQGTLNQLLQHIDSQHLKKLR